MALYLDPDRRDALIALSEKLGTSQQLLLREAVDDLLSKHGMFDKHGALRLPKRKS